MEYIMLVHRRIAKISASFFGIWIALYYYYSNTLPKSKSIEEIKAIIEHLNNEQKIYNLEQYGPVYNDTIIIGIQVHNRLLYLKWVITSLSKVRGIQATLLVFSHDWYDEEINQVIRDIRFCMVLQMFYPYSVQLHPIGFPGHDPYYCEDNDLSAYYVVPKKKPPICYVPVKQDRFADHAQIKHHWWWKANSIFSRLDCTANHTGLVVFIEDDHYVLEDFLYILHMLRKMADEQCPECDMIAAGTLTWNYSLKNDTAKAEIKSWIQNLQNMGLTMNKTAWRDIIRMQKAFCRYNDYNWDMSLLHMSIMRLKKGPFKVLTVKVPRIFHIGKCGVHFHKYNCDNVRLMKYMRKMERYVRRLLFPANMTITFIENPPRGRKREAGGWKDIRDRELCRNMTKMTRSKVQKNY